MDNITDPIEMRAALAEKQDANYYFFGSPLFDNWEAAAAGVPAAVQRIVNMASGDDKTMLQDFIDNPQFVLGESGSGFPFHQHGEAILQLLTGRKRWWLLDGGQTPPSGYRYDMSQLKWIQQTLPKLPASVKPWTCTQEPGEILYVPDSFWHATLNIGETVAVGAQAGQSGWAQIHKERGALINEVLSASTQKVSSKEAKKLVVKVDKMLKKYGANSHLLAAKVYLKTRPSSVKLVQNLLHLNIAWLGHWARLHCWLPRVPLHQDLQPMKHTSRPSPVRLAGLC